MFRDGEISELLYPGGLGLSPAVTVVKLRSPNLFLRRSSTDKIRVPPPPPPPAGSLSRPTNLTRRGQYAMAILALLVTPAVAWYDYPQ